MVPIKVSVFSITFSCRKTPVYHCHALLEELSIILGEATSFIFMAVSVREAGREKGFYSTKEKWWNCPLNHFLLLLNPKGWEEVLQFIMPAVANIIIFQSVAIRPAFQQLIKLAITINSRQRVCHTVPWHLIQSTGWLVWLVLWFHFQFTLEVGWDNQKSQWVVVAAWLPGAACCWTKHAPRCHRFWQGLCKCLLCLNAGVRAPCPMLLCISLLWYQLCLVSSRTTQDTLHLAIKCEKLNTEGEIIIVLSLISFSHTITYNTSGSLRCWRLRILTAQCLKTLHYPYSYWS